MANKSDSVVGVFLDRSMADEAVQQLQAQGFDAQVSNGRDLSGLSREQADLYGSRAQEGNAVVVVNDPSDRGEEALNIMLGAGAENIDMVRGQGSDRNFANWNTQQRTDYYRNLSSDQRQYGAIDQTTGKGKNQDQIRVQLREEQLIPTKQSNQAGQVELRKTVQEKEQQIPVNLRHEEVVVHREAVDRPIDSGQVGDLKDEVIQVPVYEERAELQKQGRVREEVTIDKEMREHQETLSGTTRREELDVQPTGDIKVEGNRGRNMDSGYTTTTETDTNFTRGQADANQYDQS